LITLIKNNIILKLNEKGINELYLVLLVCNNSNIEVIKLLISYANKYNIILEMNGNYENEKYPLLLAFNQNNNNLYTLLLFYIINLK